MKIAVLSGKGGTGKTLVSVNLAAAAAAARYIDCDVEEPNGHLFFKPQGITREPVTVKIPSVDRETCTGCRVCIDFCRFNALAQIKNLVLVFEEICHSCGGCAQLCPQKAIEERDKEIGHIERGKSGNVSVTGGFLNIGQPSGVPLIKKLLSDSCREKEVVLIDCPPGSACTVMESVSKADYCIIVTEPSLFSCHNLKMVYELVRILQKPFGVILNKYLAEDNPAEAFCLQNHIDILGRIPFDSKLANIHSNGEIAVRKNSEYQDLFQSIWQSLEKTLKRAGLEGGFQ